MSVASTLARPFAWVIAVALFVATALSVGVPLRNAPEPAFLE
jgi:hypothetical protein